MKNKNTNFIILLSTILLLFLLGSFFIIPTIVSSEEIVSSENTREVEQSFDNVLISPILKTPPSFITEEIPLKEGYKITRNSISTQTFKEDNIDYKYIGNNYGFIKTDSKNTFDTSKIVIDKNIISVIDYERVNDTELFEVFIRVDSQDGVLYSLYKSEEYAEDKTIKNLISNSYNIRTLESKDGYISFYTSSFSTFIVTIDKFILVEETEPYYICKYIDWYFYGHTINEVWVDFNYLGTDYYITTAYPENQELDLFFKIKVEFSPNAKLCVMSYTNGVVDELLLEMEVTTNIGTYEFPLIMSIVEDIKPQKIKSWNSTINSSNNGEFIINLLDFYKNFDYIKLQFGGANKTHTIYDSARDVNYIARLPYYYPEASPPRTTKGDQYSALYYDGTHGYFEKTFEVLSYDNLLFKVRSSVSNPSWSGTIGLWFCNTAWDGSSSVNSCSYETMSFLVTREEEEETPVSYDLTDGLISYYKLDETTGTLAVDSHGTNNGTANDSIIFTTEVQGIFNTGADFTQGNEYIDISSDVVDYSQGAFSGWFNVQGGEASSRNLFSVMGSNFAILRISSTEKIEFHIEGSGVTNSRFVVSSPLINEDEWYHVVVQSDGSEYEVYLNGVKRSLSFTLGSNTGHWISGINPTSLRLGGLTTSQFFNGYIDEFAFFNRTLNSTEIEQLYNNGNGLSYDNLLSKNVCQLINTNTMIDIIQNEGILYAYLRGQILEEETYQTFFQYKPINVQEWVNTTKVNIQGENLSIIKEVELLPDRMYEYRFVAVINDEEVYCNIEEFNSPPVFSDYVMNYNSYMSRELTGYYPYAFEWDVGFYLNDIFIDFIVVQSEEIDYYYLNNVANFSLTSPIADEIQYAFFRVQSEFEEYNEKANMFITIPSELGIYPRFYEINFNIIITDEPPNDFSNIFLEYNQMQSINLNNFITPYMNLKSSELTIRYNNEIVGVLETNTNSSIVSSYTITDNDIDIVTFELDPLTTPDNIQLNIISYYSDYNENLNIKLCDGFGLGGLCIDFDFNLLIVDEVTQIKNLEDVYLLYNENDLINFNEYFFAYESIEIELYEGNNLIDSLLIFIDDNFSIFSMIEDRIFIQLNSYPEQDRISLYIESFDNDYEEKIIINACRENQTECISDEFKLFVTETPITPPTPPTPPIEDGLLSGVFNTFLNLFPNPDNLTNTQKLGVVAVTMIILTLFIFVITWSSSIGISVAIIYIVGFLNILLFMFFIMAGFIPVALLVWVVLFMIGIGVIKFWLNRGES